jgi:HAE1 family hydrophobic/amphiphilic exporter-1
MKSRGDEGMLIALSLLLAYFALVVRMESWRNSLRVMLPSVVAVFGAVAALWCFNVPFSVYSRYAVVMLVALTSAMSLLSDSASGFLRRAFLPLLAAVTALPLVLSSGAGAVGSQSFGATMLGGFLVYALAGGLLVINRRDQK